MGNWDWEIAQFPNFSGAPIFHPKGSLRADERYTTPEGPPPSPGGIPNAPNSAGIQPLLPTMHNTTVPAACPMALCGPRSPRMGQPAGRLLGRRWSNSQSQHTPPRHRSRLQRCQWPSVCVWHTPHSANLQAKRRRRRTQGPRRIRWRHDANHALCRGSPKPYAPAVQRQRLQRRQWPAVARQRRPTK